MSRPRQIVPGGGRWRPAVAGLALAAAAGAAAQPGFEGRNPSPLAGSVSSEQSASVWLLGLRYRVIDAETTEQVGQGYVEEKMESGATSSAVMGVGSAVWEIDGRFK